MDDYRIKLLRAGYKKPLSVSDRGSFTLEGVIEYLNEATEWLFQPNMFFEGSDNQFLQLRGLEAVLGMEPSPIIQTSGIIETHEDYKLNSLYLAVVVIPNEI